MSTKYVIAAAALATVAVARPEDWKELPSRVSEYPKFSINRFKNQGKTRFVPALPHQDEDQEASWGHNVTLPFPITYTFARRDCWGGPVLRLPPITRPASLEEEQDEEAKANWNFNAGVSGGAGGKPQWNVGIGATWDEQQQQQQQKQRQYDPPGYHFRAPTFSTPRQPAIFDEDAEQADWNFNAGVQGGAGGKPTWNVGVGATGTMNESEQRWTGSPSGPRFPISSTGPYNPGPRSSMPFDEDEMQGFGSKLDKFLGRVDHTLDTVGRVQGLFDEEEQAVQASELYKLKRTCIKARNTIRTAVEAKILDEDQEQGFGSRLDRTLDRIDRTLNAIDRVKETFK